MNATKIEWVKNPDGIRGYTWNPITGCLNQIDGMCKDGGFPCYAYRLANGRLKPLYLANTHIAPTSLPYNIQTTLALRDPFYPRFWEDRKLAPMRQRKTPKGIFVCDMSDLFGIGIPEEWTKQVFATINCCPQHRFYLLTKQPQNLIKFSPFPENCWVGVTATDTGMAYKAVGNLKRIKARVKYISFEPLLGQVINWVGDAQYLFKSTSDYLGALDWVIIGAQTKPYKPPKIEWVEEIVRAADKAGVAVFLKDNLSDLIPINSDLRYGPAGELRLHQELPNV